MKICVHSSNLQSCYVYFHPADSGLTRASCYVVLTRCTIPLAYAYNKQRIQIMLFFFLLLCRCYFVAATIHLGYASLEKQYRQPKTRHNDMAQSTQIASQLRAYTHSTGMRVALIILRGTGRVV